MKLLNTIIVLAGGTGEVGEGMTRSFLSEGATVVVPIRSKDKGKKLKEYVADLSSGTLDLVPANIGDPEQAEEFKRQVLARHHKIDMAIASLGGWYQGYDLADMPYEMWTTIMTNNLTSHFIFARTVIPVLRKQDSGWYININGGAQDFAIPQAGGMTIISSAQNRMTEVLYKEAEGKGYEVRSVAAFSPVKTRARGTQVESSWVSAEGMGKYITKLYLGGISEDPITHKLYSDG